MPYLVLETAGKWEDVYSAKVLVFESLAEANGYVKKVSTGPIRYWTNAEIIQPGESVELCMPEGDYEY